MKYYPLDFRDENVLHFKPTSSIILSTHKKKKNPVHGTKSSPYSLLGDPV